MSKKKIAKLRRVSENLRLELWKLAQIIARLSHQETIEWYLEHQGTEFDHPYVVEANLLADRMWILSSRIPGLLIGETLLVLQQHAHAYWKQVLENK